MPSPAFPLRPAPLRPACAGGQAERGPSTSPKIWGQKGWDRECCCAGSLLPDPEAPGFVPEGWGGISPPRGVSSPFHPWPRCCGAGAGGSAPGTVVTPAPSCAAPRARASAGARFISYFFFFPPLSKQGKIDSFVGDISMSTVGFFPALWWRSSGGERISAGSRGGRGRRLLRSCWLGARG